MLNQLLRYYPVVKLINKSSPRNILELGSGSQGIGKYINQNFFGVDINFKDYFDVQQSIIPNLQAVQAQGHYLPFRDNVFDLVICVDMLEHVPKFSREQLIIELVRVARGQVFLSFPCGTNALKMDQKLFALYKKKERKCRAG
ncbi:MAG: class I SAM-dependent methyltransferase [Bacteroidota bacterium]|nr:class I SAM-dependent methyltransferase [Bacteroidota bacterium]